MRAPRVQLICGNMTRHLSANGVTLVETGYEPGQRMGRHAHERTKISLILAGGTDERSLRLDNHCDAGSAVIKPAGRDHSNVFSPVGMRTFVAYLSSTDELNDTWARRLSEYRWHHGGPIVRAMVRLYRATFGGAAVDATEVEERLYDVLAAAPVNAADTSIEASPQWVDAVRDHLHVHYCDRVAVRGLAAMVDTHPVYLARVFRKRFGCSITDYLHRLRAKRAAALLGSSESPFAHIALDAGFADQAHLCRVFKSQMGVTPGAYRRLIRAK